MTPTKPKQRHRALLRATLVGFAALLSLQAQAALVTSRAALGGNDFVDWGQLGPSGTETGGNSFVASSSLGVAATVSKPANTFFTFDAADYGGNLGGNVLFSNFEPGSVSPFSLVFGSSQARVGAQIQANDFGAFTGRISVFDVGNLLLETWDFGGLSNGNQDNSAIFLGVTRAGADIGRVQFSLVGAQNAEFAINRLDLNVQGTGGGGGGTNPAPEPASLALVGLGLLGLLGSRSRSRNAGSGR